jgi:hypothetical protein
MTGYQERKRGGLSVYSTSGDILLYDNKNNLLNYPDRVWCVFRKVPDDGLKPMNVLDSIFESYDEAFDRAYKTDGALQYQDVKRKLKK